MHHHLQNQEDFSVFYFLFVVSPFDGKKEKTFENVFSISCCFRPIIGLYSVCEYFYVRQRS